MTHAWSMYLGVSGVRWPLAKTHLHVIMGNLHFKKSRSQVTADDPKLFFQMLDICSGNITFEGYWKNSSSCKDIDPWSSRINSESSHFEKSRFCQGQMTPDSPRYIYQACAIYCFVARYHTLCSAKGIWDTSPCVCARAHSAKTGTEIATRNMYIKSLLGSER